MPTKTQDWLDDYLHPFPRGTDFGSDPELRERQRELYDRMRDEKRHMYDDPKLLQLAVKR